MTEPSQPSSTATTSERPEPAAMLGERVGAGVSAGVDVGGLDRDAGVLGLVLLVEVVVAEGAERGDGQLDRVVAGAAGFGRR